MSGPLLYVVLVAFGLLVGTLSGVLGVGGGIFMVPFMVVVLKYGQHEAQATSLLVIIPTTIVATRRLHLNNVASIRTGWRIGLCGACTSAIGAVLALHLPGQTLRILFAILMVVVAVRLLRDALRTPSDELVADTLEEGKA